MFTELEKQLKLHIDLSPEDFETIKRYFVPKKLRKKQLLLDAGDISTRMAFVEKGALYSYSSSENGSTSVVQFAFEGWWMSDLYSFLTREPSKLSIEALEDSEILLLKADALDELIKKAPVFDSYLRILYQNAYISLQHRIERTISQNAEQRYLSFMQDRKDILLRVPQHLIASFLGITPETLSRIRKKI